MRHCHACGCTERGCAAPVGHTTSFGGVVVDDVDGIRIDQAAHAMTGDFALAGIDRYSRSGSHAGHLCRVIVPMAWFLEPAYVERLDEAGEMNGLVGRPSAIGINRQNEVGTCRLARGLHALGIRAGRQTSDLELAA